MALPFRGIALILSPLTPTTKEKRGRGRGDPPPVKTGLAGFFAKFGVLKKAQRELWLTFLIKFLIYTAYSVTNKTMVLWLSRTSASVIKQRERWSAGSGRRP